MSKKDKKKRETKTKMTDLGSLNGSIKTSCFRFSGFDTLSSQITRSFFFHWMITKSEEIMVESPLRTLKKGSRRRENIISPFYDRSKNRFLFGIHRNRRPSFFALLFIVGLLSFNETRLKSRSVRRVAYSYFRFDALIACSAAEKIHPRT